jgi:2-C-methyl-D-erythritol 4-phosphate cytidylyltransferase/2-C-methyl-D-erythritol 2,4-cyclodiphosphate synthase
MTASRDAAKSGSACWAVIVAGGSGVRLRQDRPKAFVSLAGRPILEWSLRAFARHPAVTDILAVVPRGWAAQTERAILGPLRRTLPRAGARIHRPVIGGARRQDSVRAGLEEAARLCRGGNLGSTAVLVHDAARPIVSAGLIDELLACLNRAGAEPILRGAVPVLPVGDTLKAVAGAAGLDGSGGSVTSTVDRDGLWCAQTPQAFPLGPVLHAHREAHAAGRSVTDDAVLFEMQGWPVTVTAGSVLGLKITYPEELSLLEGWLRGPGAWYGRAARGAARRRDTTPGSGARPRPPARGTRRRR